MVKLKDLPRVDRPREKLRAYGPAKLTTSELLAILLRTGTGKANVVELARSILQQIGIQHLRDSTLADLARIKGVGEVKALEVLACIELGKRILKQQEPLRAVTPQTVYESLRDMRSLKKEHFVAIYLDTQNEEVAREIISIGTLNASLVHPREVFEPALRHVAASIIVAHNHPSGNLKPSHEDLLVTKKLVDSGILLDIHVLDHIIVTNTGYVSMKERGLL
jgi:DNA repair protein RadC